MSTIIETLEKKTIGKRPDFRPGDAVRVHFEVVEGKRKRTQVFEGLVIKKQGSGARETFTVRKSSFGVGVERTFPLHSPKIEKLELVSRGEVRRAKLYYLRDKVGKRARVTEKRGGIPAELIETSEEATDSEGMTASEAEVEDTAPQEDSEAAEGESQADAEAKDEGDAKADVDAEDEGDAEAKADADDAETGEADDAEAEDSKPEESEKKEEG